MQRSRQVYEEILPFRRGDQRSSWSRSRSEDRASKIDRIVFFREFARASIFILLFGFVLLFTSVRLLETATPYRHDVVVRHRRFLEALALSLPVSVLLCVLIASIDIGLLTKKFTFFDQMIPIARLVSWQQLLLGGTGASFAVFVLLLMFLESLRAYLIRNVSGLLSFLSRVTIWWSLALLVLALVSLNGAILFYPQTVSYLLGPLGVLFVFLGFLCITLSLLGYIYDRFQVPIIAFLIVSAFTWAYIPTNDNHTIRLLPNQVPDPPEAADAFKEWLRNRPDLNDYKDRPYPVYIITAEGGGLFAAAHAAWTIAKIQDNCPAFARHVFAISSVSGGSLGSAIFAALVKALPARADLQREEKCQPERAEIGPMQLAVQLFFSEDFLTPLLAATLFPDLIQRFWPWGIGALDRTRALEDAFESGWRKIVPNDKSGISDIFSRSSRELWAPREDQPALLLNTTLVQSGERVIIAPFKLREIQFFPFIDRFVDELNEKRAPLLKAAVSTSARFPLVTPPGLIQTKNGLSLQLVDGGYYENSGVFTAMNLIDLIRHASTLPLLTTSVTTSSSDGGCGTNNNFTMNISATEAITACIKVISIRRQLPEPRFFHAGDLLSLFPTMSEARVAKGVANLALANNLYCGGERCGFGTVAVDPHIYVKYLDIEGMRLPLGWYLSRETLKSIFDSSLPSAGGDCLVSKTTKRGYRRVDRGVAAAEENACLLPRVRHDLTGR